MRLERTGEQNSTTRRHPAIVRTNDLTIRTYENVWPEGFQGTSAYEFQGNSFENASREPPAEIGAYEKQGES